MSLTNGSSDPTPKGWRIARLNDLKRSARYSFVGGPFGSNLTRNDYVAEPGVPVIRGTNLGGDTCQFIDDNFVYVTEEKADSLKQNLAYPGDLVFTQRGTLGQVVEIPRTANHERYVVSQSQMKLTVEESEANPRFIYHYFRSPRAVGYLNQRIQATGVPHINLEILKDFPIVLPSIEQQHRIAAILDKADAIRRKREESIRLTEELLRSTFLEMFGDPVSNTRQWASRSVGELAEVQGGLQLAPFRDSHPIKVPYLRVANVYRDRLDLQEIKQIGCTDGELRRARLMAGDILVVEGHGNRDEIGRAAIWDGSIDDCVHQNHLIRVRASCSEIEPAYFNAFINSEGGRRQLIGFGKTTSGLNTISVSNVRQVAVLVPPLELQRRFSARILKAKSLLTSRQRAYREGETLFRGLIQRAFRGEL